MRHPEVVNQFIIKAGSIEGLANRLVEVFRQELEHHSPWKLDVS